MRERLKDLASFAFILALAALAVWVFIKVAPWSVTP